MKICLLLVCWGLLGIISFVNVNKQNKKRLYCIKQTGRKKFKICRTLPLQPLKRWTVDLKWTRICYKKVNIGHRQTDRENFSTTEHFIDINVVRVAGKTSTYILDEIG